MAAPKRNGPEALHNRPAKTLTKHAADFIARCGILAGQNPWVIVVGVVAVLEAARLVLGVLL
jgi:hypothetical protein